MCADNRSFTNYEAYNGGIIRMAVELGSMIKDNQILYADGRMVRLIMNI